MAGLMGAGSRQSYAATFPPDRYYCLLDELPLHLIPRPASREHRITPQGLVFNPECTLCSDGHLPDEMSPLQESLSRFALQGSIAWVRDAATRCLLPFWLGPNLEAVLKSYVRGEFLSSAMPETVGHRLQQAGILIAMDRVVHPCGAVDRIGESAALFQKRGYAPLPELIHPYHVAALRRYYRYLIRSGELRLGDKQSDRRYVAYNEPVARFFHQHIARWMAVVAGRPVKPSYVYLASYLSGAELRKHTDRVQCEYSVTFCLDFSPEPVLETPWPIRLETADGTVTVYQALSDGLAYRGTQVPHSRGRLGDGQTSTSIFFHYVPADFSESLE
jgi:hypothetical protein